MKTSLPVLVTGATGFIATHIIEQLLAGGYRVRGTVRSLKKKPGYAHLISLPGASERLDLCEADLLTEGSFDEAARGVELVVHAASPYVLTPKDPQKDLVEPAVRGTENLLSACEASGSVKRVVLTSSMAAVTDEPDEAHVLTEDDWNDRSSLERNPYYYSKTLAERAAWKRVYGVDKPAAGATSKTGFELVVINPFLVIGPSLSPGINTSNQVLVDLLSGGYPAIVNLTWGIVDVRDVARAHIEALEVDAASGRYVCANTTRSMREVVELLTREGYAAGYKLPTLGLDCGAGDAVVRLGSYAQPKGVGTYLRSHIGRVPRFSHDKIVRELGLEFRPVEQSILDTVADLERHGHVKRRS